MTPIRGLATILAANVSGSSLLLGLAVPQSLLARADEVIE